MTATTGFEAGYAADDTRVHASRPAIGGASALCGAGRIRQSIAGRFGTTVVDPCPDCLVAAAESSPWLEVARSW